jgi:hypothetical protein
VFGIAVGIVVVFDAARLVGAVVWLGVDGAGWLGVVGAGWLGVDGAG